MTDTRQTPDKRHPRLCKDCRWFLTDAGMCQHPTATHEDLVYGSRFGQNPYIMRQDKCGPEGRLWEPREGVPF